MSERPVRVNLRRTGGFAGRELHSRLDTDELPPAEAAEVDALVASLDAAALTDAAGATPARMPDAMRYELDIEGTERHWRLVLVEPDIPPQARPLLNRLVAAARP
jgi:hypothetical protein